MIVKRIRKRKTHNRKKWICPDAEHCPAKDCRHIKAHTKTKWCTAEVTMCRDCILTSEYKRRKKHDQIKKKEKQATT